MTTAITRLAKEVRDEYYPVDFDVRLDRLAKIVLELEKALENYAQDLGPDKPNTAKRALARCQQIASEGRDG